MEKNWDSFLFPYSQALEEIKVKLKGQRKLYQKLNTHSPIEFVTGRLKPVSSILHKMEVRQIKVENLETEMEDIAGIRIMCPFIEDIDDVLDLIRSRDDLQVVYEKDYIKNKKESGYRSYHVVCKYPVYMLTEKKEILVEIQIRTLAMNFWASIEHSLKYKLPGEYPEQINRRLQGAAEKTFSLDEEMSAIKELIIESSERDNDGDKELVDEDSCDQ